MASGHVNRIYRPNTWLHRPMLQNVKTALANSEPSTDGDGSISVAELRCDYNPFQASIAAFPAAIRHRRSDQVAPMSKADLTRTLEVASGKSAYKLVIQGCLKCSYCKRRPNTSWSSTSRPLKCSASTFPRRGSPAQTRRSTKRRKLLQRMRPLIG